MLTQNNNFTQEDIFFRNVFNYVYSIIGPGHSECVYSNALAIEIQNSGWEVSREYPIIIKYRARNGQYYNVGTGKLDLLCRKNNYIVIIEVKTLLPIQNIKSKKEYYQIERYIHAIENDKKIEQFLSTIQNSVKATFPNSYTIYTYLVNFPYIPLSPDIFILSAST